MPRNSTLLRAVDLGGQTRIVAAAPVCLHLQDIAEDGQVLITSDAVNYRVGTGESKSVDLPGPFYVRIHGAEQYF